jgi:DNA invertase Pin-like site-specific DNA recombinase
MRAAIYARISQDRAGAGLGVKRQRQDCEALAKQRGWTVVATFTDNDTTAYRAKRRPGYQRLIEAIKAGDVQAVVAWHSDRLHRDNTELEAFIAVVEAHRVKVATVQSGDIELGTSSGRMAARVVGAVAQHESEQKSERLRRQRRQAATEGRPHGGGRSFGYDADGVTLRADEAVVVRECVDRVLNGEPVRAIARDLNARGVTGPSGARWSVTTLKAMLTGPRLAGLRVHQGAVLGSAQWPSIISLDEHHRVRAVLGTPRSRKRGRPPSSLLTGLVRCGACGGRMAATAAWTGPSRTIARRYVCAHGPGQGCGRCGIYAAPLDEKITEAVFKVLDTRALARRLTKGSTGKDDSAAVIEDIDNRLGDLADLYAQGQVTKAEWVRARAGLDERRTAAVLALTTPTETAPLRPWVGRKGALRKAWPALSIDERRAIVGAVVDTVTIAPTAKRGERFDEDRISVQWRA